jgi:hypothetical protein
VHRDLKPANVFLAVDRHNELVPKIVDFGLSKLITTSLEAETAPLTAHDSVIGTVQYMAPEQTFGTKYADDKADQYSLAAILYEALVGQPPFKDESFYGLLDKVRNAPLVLPTSLVPGLDPAIDPIVARALAREPGARFEDVRAFARELLPLADARTRAAWERDFAAPTAVPPAASSAPASRRVSTPRPPPGGIPQATVQSSSVRPTAKLPCEPGASPFHIKGTAYRGVITLVDERVPGGIGTLERELEDERLATFVRQPFLAASRYDLLPMLPINLGVARLLGRSLEALASEQGERQALYDIEKLYARLFAMMTFDNLPTVLARFDGQYLDFGDCGGTVLAPGHLLLRRAGLPEYVLRWFAPMYSSYIAQILRQKGAAFVEVTPRGPQDAGMRATFAIVDLEIDIRWQK